MNSSLESVFAEVERLGLGLSILAWVTVFTGAVAMGVVLSKFPMRTVWIPALVVGVLSLAAHLADYSVTLRVSPTLADEANPIWRIVIDRLGIGFAKVYGLTGKILLAVLSFEFFSYYLARREQLFPKQAAGFFSFWRQFGGGDGAKTAVRWRSLVNCFSFVFALLGPFFFYVAYLNSIVADPLYGRLPSVPLALVLYVGVLLVAYGVMTHRAFQSRKSVRRG